MGLERAWALGTGTVNRGRGEPVKTGNDDEQNSRGVVLKAAPMVEKIARTLLYEGYILYPYRRSALKNQHRWNFGVLYPESFTLATAGTAPNNMQIECLLFSGTQAAISVTVRFLHLAVSEPTDKERCSDVWQEAVERAVVAGKPLPQGSTPSYKREGWAYDEGRRALSWAKAGLTPTPAKQLPPAIRDIIKTLKETGKEMLDVIEGADWKTTMRERILSARRALLRHPWASRVLESRGEPTPTVIAYFDSMMGSSWPAASRST